MNWRDLTITGLTALLVIVILFRRSRHRSIHFRFDWESSDKIGKEEEDDEPAS